MTNNNNNNNSWTKDLRAAILLWGAKDRSQRPGRSQTGVGGQQDPQPWPGRGQCCCPSSSYSPTPSPPPPHATCFSLGTPQDSIVPRAGGGSPCRVGGGCGGVLTSCSSPPLSPLEVRTGFQAQVQPRWGSHEQLRTHGHDTHPTHRQTHRPAPRAAR